ncbi:MAG: carbohydrate binding domain-containing protein [Janthinobacterium lividum]
MQTARQVASLLTLAALGLAATPVAAAPAAPGTELSQPLRNPDAWALDLAGGTKATLKRAQDGTVAVTVSVADSTDYHVRLGGTPVSLAEGKVYTVRFRAKADQPRIIKVYAQIDHGDFHGVGLDMPVSLGDQWGSYTFSFKATGVEPKHVSCPQFLLGSRTGTVWLANVSLTLAPAGTIPTPPPTALVWDFHNFDPCVGSLRQEGTAQVVTIASADGVAWHVQLNRLGSTLVEGQPITVRFRARASAPRDMLVSGQVVGGDYHGIVKDDWEELSTDWKDYSFHVTPHDIGGKPVLFPQFLLGHMTGTVWIDHVTTTPDTTGAADATVPGGSPMTPPPPSP